MPDPGVPPTDTPIPGSIYRQDNVRELFNWMLTNWDNPVHRDALVDRLAPDLEQLNDLLRLAKLSPRQLEAVRLRFALGEQRAARQIRGEMESEMTLSYGRIQTLLAFARGKLVSAVLRKLYQ